MELMQRNRRTRETIGLALGLILLAAMTATAGAFGFEEVRREAERLSKLPYEASPHPVPPALTRLTWSEHDQIRFKPDEALWRKEKLPFLVEFFHPGYVHRDMVDISEIHGDRVDAVSAGPRFYDYGTNRLELPADLGHAGFRLVRNADAFGETAVFLGASYFRMIGRGQNYGASARGLAVNTTEPGGEEFPVFRRFWVQRPGRGDETATVFALLDSPSATGAYRFQIHPGAATVAHIKAVLFPRHAVKQFGLAPLTSMFLHGENGRPRFEDFRPEVHDSDGLLLHTGESRWIWHPLEAGRMLRVNAFADRNSKGFGLMQRDRDADHYQDPVASFEKRPSVWVEPIGDWGSGRVELIQIPSLSEFQDNVVAFWVPAEGAVPGRPIELAYRLHWTREEPSDRPGHVLATRIGRVVVEPPKDPANLRFVVDFGGPALASLPADAQLSVRSTLPEGVQLVADSLFRIHENRIWRLVLEVADPGRAFDLSAVLTRKDLPVTETWTFTWQP